MKSSVDYYPLMGMFVACGKLKSSNPDVWIDSYVRLDCIKSVHENLNDPERCTFHTYKDEWYSCLIRAIDLIYLLNYTLKRDDID